jgi:N6-adenosine-specific RNA methylase IME4
MGKEQFRDGNAVAKRGRRPLRASGAMTDAERAKRYRTRKRRQKNLARPHLVAKQARRAERERALAAKIAHAEATLEGGQRRYGVILADPPWQFEPWSRQSGLDRAADNHYPTTPTNHVASLVPPAADDAVLFLWATAPMMPQALDVMAAWGFTYRSQIVWVKPRIGTGYWVRSRHEVLLIGTKGRIPAPAIGTQPASILDAPTSGHSVKPAAVYDMIESMFPMLPKLEMFARQARPGWEAWGAEAPEAA